MHVSYRPLASSVALAGVRFRLGTLFKSSDPSYSTQRSAAPVAKDHKRPLSVHLWPVALVKVPTIVISDYSDKMPSASRPSEFMPEPDLHPLYPAPFEVARLLSANSGLSPIQKSTLVTHCMTRACIFADLSFFQYILHDPQAHPFLDLNYQDEDGLAYVSVIIEGFGSESERDVEREECVRLLIAEGADVNIPDKAGWTPLHHAALLAPPTLISYLLTHGCSPFLKTSRGMTALDIVTAYAVIPGREDVALFLEEAMKGEGWQGSKLNAKRHVVDRKLKEREKRFSERRAISKILELSGDMHWWRENDMFESPVEDSEDEGDGEEQNDDIYTPPPDYSSMLVFSPASLSGILDSLITNFMPSRRNATPANGLYMLARFACLTCDHTWLEELVMGAADAIEDVAFNHPDDLTYSIFWLYNCTIWLHLMRCDSAISETCELVGSFELIEEIINTVYVLIIRVAERRIDGLIDTALLDYSPPEAELEQVQFESEWSIFRSPFSKKRVASQTITPSSTVASIRSSRPDSPTPGTSRPTSPVPQQGSFMPLTLKGFSSIGNAMTRHRVVSTASLQSFMNEGPPPSQTPQELVIFLSALHELLVDSGINPAIITQLWSQVMYWTSSETFNRILTRKRYLCRSRALQIGMNLSVLEEWLADAGLPRGVASHFNPVRELLLWLQCLSSMDDFSNLIATIQTLKNLNPLQMRRAVRDYKYEVNELRMSDDCSQYLMQLQKDWERQRVRLGVEAMRKEITDRGDDDDDDDSFSSINAETNESSTCDKSYSASSVDDLATSRSNVDLLFDKSSDKSEWTPQQPPEVLGELLESRYMLLLVLPSDPRMLSAVIWKRTDHGLGSNPNNPDRVSFGKEHVRTPGNARLSHRRVLDWVTKGRHLREVGTEILDYVDGSSGSGRWRRRAEIDTQDEEATEGVKSRHASTSHGSDEERPRLNHVHLTSLARAASSRIEIDSQQADAESILTPVNSIPSQDNTPTRPLELLGTIPRRIEPLVTEVIWQNTIDWSDQIEIVYYKRPKHGSMRHYSLLGIDLDLLLTIPSAEKATSLDAQHSKIQSSQDCFTEKRICSQRGIDSCSIDRMNSADRIMTQLRSVAERSVLSEPRSSNSPTTSHALLVVKKICEICADLLYSLRINAPRLYGVATSDLALVQQLDLRCEQTVFVLRQAWLLDRTRETSNDKISAHYISTQNCIWLILNDVIIGCAVGIFLADNNRYLARTIHTFVETWIIDSIRQSIHWLDNWPAGLKLNTELSRFLFLVFSALLDSWEVVLKNVGGLLPSVITIIGMSGILGMTMVLASLSDLISLLSIHLSMSYAITRVAFKAQLLMVKSLFNLFRGKRYNVLRARVDDWDYDLDQLLLGAMLLTLVNFLFPTITVYYILFALTRFGVQALQAGIKIALALLNHFPLFALTLRIKDPWRLPGGIVFRPCRPTRLNEQEQGFIIQNSPITLSKIFGQYYALGAKLGTHYNPSRLIMELLKGNSLDPIPLSSVRYSYSTRAPSG
ncbi:hypothetical protein A7U60_g4260 [Sanghuangporus baumii]|uniref:Dilute domain-containing protein n=1 Tax=Sanghuangporus baumii TaxID=108892 RepID=A0A9Q5HYV8_SANBA|nr:hypothetical protein A7U60_g4260 [Sanghuangporus baumii]